MRIRAQARPGSQCDLWRTRLSHRGPGNRGRFDWQRRGNRGHARERRISGHAGRIRLPTEWPGIRIQADAGRVGIRLQHDLRSESWTRCRG